MIPTVAVPNVQIPPPSVEASLFAGQSSDPAVGRLPLHSVPPPINSQKVADNNREQQQTRSGQEPPQPSIERSFASLLQSGEGDIELQSPFSTPFMAQLFGQIPAFDNVIGGLFGEGTGVPAGFVDFNRLAEFNTVKYKPSHAFKPHEKPEQQQALEDFGTTTPKEAKAEMRLEAAMAVPEASRPDTDVPSAQLENLGQLATRQLSDTKPDIAPLNTPESRPVAQSAPADDIATVPNPGVEAYLSTQSRNENGAAVAKAPTRAGGHEGGVSLIL